MRQSAASAGEFSAADPAGETREILLRAACAEQLGGLALVAFETSVAAELFVHRSGKIVRANARARALVDPESGARVPATIYDMMTEEVAGRHREQKLILKGFDDRGARPVPRVPWCAEVVDMTGARHAATVTVIEPPAGRADDYVIVRIERDDARIP